MRSPVLIVIILSIFSSFCYSQENSDIKIARWNFSLTTGGIIGGPCNPMRESLLHYGIDNELEVEKKNNLPLVFEAGWGINKYLWLSLNMNILYQEMEAININFNSIVINPLISYKYKDFIFIGLGPALNAISYFHSTASSITDGRDFFKPGLIIKSSLEYPKSSRAYVRLEMQYNFGAAIDPVYTVVGVGTSQYSSRSVRLDPFPVNYFYAGIGLGFRLYKKI
jgi:hypothetical protein